MLMDFKSELEKNKDSFISDLRGLIAIPSVVADADGEYPFGRNVQRALEYMLDLGESMGFTVKNVDNYGGHIEFPGTEEGIMAILGHIDVVAQGEGWTADPFGGEVVDGWIYGRGAQDDKGPTMMGLYVMKVLKDLGFMPKKTIRLILGLDEETLWDGMKYYLSKEKTPDFGIVPDADFPLVQCEKGLLEFDIVKEDSVVNGGLAGVGLGVDGAGPGVDEAEIAAGKAGPVLEFFLGGTAPNVVAGEATALISGPMEILNEINSRIVGMGLEKGYHVETSISGDGPTMFVMGENSPDHCKLSIHVKGQTAHAATPHKGKNAISMAFDLIGDIEFANLDGVNLLNFYNRQIGFDLMGGSIGCQMSDELSGSLTFNVGKIKFDGDEARITVDIRYPVTKSREIIYKAIEPALAEAGFHIEEIDHIGPIYKEPDSHVVKTLLDVYREISGDRESLPKVIGGATFARAIPNCMAFGPLFPGDPELEHQKDEKIEIAQLLKAGLIYCQAVYRLTK